MYKQCDYAFRHTVLYYCTIELRFKNFEIRVVSALMKIIFEVLLQQVR